MYCNFILQTQFTECIKWIYYYYLVLIQETICIHCNTAITQFKLTIICKVSWDIPLAKGCSVLPRGARVCQTHLAFLINYYVTTLKIKSGHIAAIERLFFTVHIATVR